MTKFEMPTYSLWLCPSNQETNQTLRHVITTFSDRLGTPKWNPHITLQGGIEDSLDKVIERTQLVAKGIEPFTLTLDDVCIKELYFQCVMATPAPHTFLTNLNALTRHIFNKVNDPPFWPHLSLIYGDLDGSVKQALASECREMGVVGLEVVVDCIQVWRTEGVPGEWEEVFRVPFGKS